MLGALCYASAELKRRGHTFEGALDFKELLSSGILGGICRVEVEVLLDNVKEVVIGEIVDGFAARNSHMLSLDLEQRSAIGCFDIEAVARERQDLFLENNGLAALGDEAVELADWLANLWECHDVGEIWMAELKSEFVKMQRMRCWRCLCIRWAG